MENIDETGSIQFADIFDLKEIQQIQDLFSDATGVASIITHPDGTPITAPSNFTHLCNNIIRKTEKGCRNCYKSDAIIGGYNPSGATVQPCLSGGLWDAGACITVGDKHIANWLIGQVRSGDLKEPRWLKYADEIGADGNEFLLALADVPAMPIDKFMKLADMLFVFANQLSGKAYQNLLLKNEIQERENATFQLQQSKENLAITLNSIGDGVITTDDKGSVVNINPIAEALSGWALSEALGKPLSEVFQIINPITREAIFDPVKKVLESGNITTLANNTTLISKTGDEYMIADSAAPIKNKEGKISGVVLVFSDVTEKNVAQEKIKTSEEKFQALYYNMAEGAALHELIYDSQGVATDYRIIETNPAFGFLLGIERESVIGKTSMEAYKVEYPPFFETYLQVALSGEAKLFETYFPPLDKHFSISVYSPYIGSFATIFNDITERKLSEAALQINEAKYRKDFSLLHSLIESPIDIIVFALDLNYCYTAFTHFHKETIKKIWGVDIHTGMNMLDCISDPEDKKKAKANFDRVLKGDYFTLTEEYGDKMFSRIWYDNYYSAIKDADGNIIGLSVFVIDVTSRRFAEEELRLSKTALSSLLGNLRGMVYSCSNDKDWTMAFVSEGSLELTGYLNEEFTYRKTILFNEIIHPDDREYVWQTIQDAIKEKDHYELEYRIVTKDGSVKNVWERGIGIFNADGSLNHLEGFIADITRQKQSEEALQQAEYKYRYLLENSGIGIGLYSLVGEILLFNSKALQNLGGKSEDYVGKTIAEVFGQKTASEYFSRIKDLGKANKSVEYEDSVPLATGNFWFLSNYTLIKGIDGKILGVQVISHDISERKKAEQEIQKLGKHYQALIENAPDGIVQIDAIGNYKYASPSARKIFGYSLQQDLAEVHRNDKIHPDDREMVLAEMVKIINDPSHISTLQYRFSDINGNWKWVESTFTNLLADPIIESVVINFRDITERKEIEAALKVSEEKFRYLVRDMQVGVLLQTPDAEIVLSNPKALELLGLTNDQLLGKTSFDPDWNVIHEDGSPFPGDTHPVPMAIETHEPVHNVVMGVYRPLSGDRVWLLVDAEPQLNPDGSIDQVVCSFVDITKRKKVEEALLESEIKFREMADLLPQIVFETDVEGKLTYVNKQAFIILGYPDDYPVIGLNTLDLYTPESKARAIENIRNVILYPHKVVSNEYTMLRRDGTTFQALVYSNQIVKNNIPIGLRGIIVDISYRIKAEEAIKKSEERFRVLFEGAPDAIILADPETGKLLDANNAASRLLGKNRTEIVGMFQYELHPQNIHSESKATFYQHIQESKNKGFTQVVEKEVVRHDGSLIPVEILGQSILLDGKMVFMGTFRDISERKQAQEALKRSESVYRAILLASPDAITISDLDGKYTMVSPSALALVGLNKEEEMLGRHFTEFIAPGDRERAFAHATLMSQGIKTGPNQYLGLRPDGNIVDIEVNGSRIKDDKGKITNFVFSVRDITERRKAELELQEKNKELRKINTEKDKFFSIIAHDLRSPFNGFLGLTQIMAEDLPSLTMSEIQNIAVNMRNAATNLYRLLENLLHWTRIEQGMIPFNPETLELKPIIDESLIMVLELARNKGIEISYQIPDGMNVFADSNILQTLLRNLVSNAVKFTPKAGKINLSAKHEADGSIKICVQDSGIGMDKDMIGKLFQIDENTSRKGTEGEPSTGLGLIICKDFVEKHGGKLWVVSEVDKGSEFCFTLPTLEAVA